MAYTRHRQQQRMLIVVAWADVQATSPLHIVLSFRVLAILFSAGIH